MSNANQTHCRQCGEPLNSGRVWFGDEWMHQQCIPTTKLRFDFGLTPLQEQQVRQIVIDVLREKGAFDE